MPKAAFVLTVPWEVKLGCGLPTPRMAFREKHSQISVLRHFEELRLFFC